MLQLALAVGLTQDAIEEIEEAGVVQKVQQAVTNQLKGLLDDTALDGVPHIRVLVNEQPEQLLRSAYHVLDLVHASIAAGSN